MLSTVHDEWVRNNHVSVYYDRNAMSPGTSCLTVPVFPQNIKTGGVFHPKVIIIYGIPKGKSKATACLFVSSCNLTVSGYGRNKEAFSCVEIKSSQLANSVSEFKPMDKIFDALMTTTDWGEKMGIDTVGGLNMQICKGSINDIIMVQEALQERRISEIAREIVERGTVKVSDEVEIVGLQDEARKSVVTGVEMFRKLLDQAEAGDNIGVLLRGIDKKEIERGQVIAKPGSIHPHTKFNSEVYVLTKEEGGRHTPFFNGYRPQFYFRTTDVTGDLHLPEGTEMCMPGDNVVMEIELITPIAIEEGLRFAIREGGRTVGSGVVTEIVE